MKLEQSLASSPVPAYVPEQAVLARYADVLVNFALGGGKGVKKHEVVFVALHEVAKPLLPHLQRAILKAGAHMVLDYRPDDGPDMSLSRTFYELAGPHHLSFFPDKHMRGVVDQADHLLMMISETDKKVLAGIPPEKMMKRGQAWKPYMEWRNEKESAGKFTWTLGLYGTEAMAKEAGLSLKEYWEQIIQACFLDKKDPIGEWKKTYRLLESTRVKLNKLTTKKGCRLHVEGPAADLWIAMGEKRQWMGGSGRNVPSFELFTSPDWRGTEGWIRFNQPLYRYGNLIEGVELRFKKGKVVSAAATKNEKVLEAMIATKNADKIGEYSLTDKRFSRITKFMAETLFDENVGGPQGNTHLAVGASYHDCYAGEPSKPTKAEWEKLGYNDSSVHTDIVSTEPRTVTAHFEDGTSKVIYQDGMFTL